MFVKINTGPEPKEVGGPISPDNLVQNGIYICIDDDPDEPGPAGWPRYKFKNQNVQIASVPTGYSILNNPETYTTNDVDAVTYFALHSSDDLDGNHVVDVWEMLLAEKFSPVLHKHSHDLQQGLQNIDNILNNQGRLIVVNNSGQTEYDQNTPPIHVNDSYQWCTFGVGQQPVYIKIDIDDTQRYLSAPAGQRPLYFHCYYDYPYYFLQYWYFFTMNDIQSHTLNSTYHEGDWEHVSLKLIRENDLFRPLYTNFYQHEGGHTHNVQNCWWSSNNDYSYAGIQQGYDENHTHLHVWLARNSHASYNRYDPIYKIHIDWFNGIISEENYIDNVDYEPNSYNLYFEYDYLEKLGKIEQSPLQQSSNGGYYPYAHGHYWLEHYIHKTNSKSWLAYIGRVGGNWWHNSFVATPAALMPSFEYGGSKAHEYKSFSHDESQAGFGNQKDTGSFLFFLRGNISWQPDPPDGD